MISKTYYHVKIRFTESLLGSCSKDPKVYKRFIENKKENSKPEPESTEPPVSQEDEAANIARTEEGGWTGFLSDDKGLFIFNYCQKGYLKDKANLLKTQFGLTNLKSKVDNFLFVNPRRLYLGKPTPDDVLERPLRAMTMQGPRVTLARSDLVLAGLELEYDIKVVDGPHGITKDVLKDILDFGEDSGCGQWRNGGYGTFEVVEFKEIEFKDLMKT